MDHRNVARLPVAVILQVKYSGSTTDLTPVLLEFKCASKTPDTAKCPPSTMAFESGIQKTISYQTTEAGFNFCLLWRILIRDTPHAHIPSACRCGINQVIINLRPARRWMCLWCLIVLILHARDFLLVSRTDAMHSCRRLAGPWFWLYGREFYPLMLNGFVGDSGCTSPVMRLWYRHLAVDYRPNKYGAGGPGQWLEINGVG